MARVNLLLMLALVGCALALVTSQHHSRKLFAELEREQRVGKRLEEEWSQLQLEQGTWAAHSRIERIAAGTLRMHAPPPSRVRLVPGAAGSSGAP
jgi:cell division protein FtsL